MEPQFEEHYVESLSNKNQKLHVKNFIWSPNEWPSIKHDDFSDDIPVISLGGVRQKSNKDDQVYDTMCQTMVEAAQKWGFFKLMDHGVAHEIINDISVCLNKLFDLPMEQKLKGARTQSLPLGYSASNLDYGHNLPWAEILQLLQSPQQVVEFSKRVYGDQNQQEFSNEMIRYMEAMDELGITILEMIAHGLGLENDVFTRHMLQEKESTIIRANRYPPCPLPGQCLGLGSHSDPHTLTILLQDEVGGLQVQNNHNGNEWLGIRPLPNSFVVNIGDRLEAWTNGRLKSVIHRAVVNEERHRLSVAYFISPSTNTLIESPPQLIDSSDKHNNTYKYKPFTWGQFKQELLKQKRVVGKTALNRYLLMHPQTNE
ncbi:hypothetical protein ABFS83_01G102800 [Erythranthe nasuta]